MGDEKDKKIIILASKNIQIGWKKNIYDPEKKDNQCTGDTYLSVDELSGKGVDKRLVERRAKEKRRLFYEYHTYRRFASSVRKYIKKRISGGDMELGGGGGGGEKINRGEIFE